MIKDVERGTSGHKKGEGQQETIEVNLEKGWDWITSEIVCLDDLSPTRFL